MQMFTVATFDDIVRLGDGLAESGTGAGGVTFLVTFVVVRLFHPFLPSAPLVLYPTPLISPCKSPPFQLSKWLLVASYHKPVSIFCICHKIMVWARIEAKTLKA